MPGEAIAMIRFPTCWPRRYEPCGWVSTPAHVRPAAAEEDPADNAVDVSAGVSPAGQQPFRRALPGLAGDGPW